MAANGTSAKSADLQQTQVYRTAKGMRIAFGIILPVLVAGILAFAVYALFSRGFGDRSGRIALCLIASAFALFLAYAWVAILRYRVEVGPDRLARIGAFFSREMRFDAIEGIRIVQAKNSRILVFVPKDKAGKKLKINLMMSRSKQFHAWARATFRDLDAEQREADLRNILADESLGDDAEARGRKYRFAMRLTRVANGAGTAALVWAFLYPEPYAVLMWFLLCLPFAAIAAAAPFPGLIRFSGPPKGAYPILSPVILMPALGLALRALLDRDILEWSRFWTPFAIVSLLLFASVLFRFPETRSKPRDALLLFLFAGVYGYGATIAYNCVQDRSPFREYRAAVEAKRVSHGKHTSYYLTLSPWGPKSAPEEVSVASEVYGRVGRRDSVSVWMRNGALGIPWFTVTAE